MDVKLRFPILRPLKLDDAWPLDGSGVEMSFEMQNGAAVALVLHFRNQPTNLAPTVERLSGPVKAQIKINGEIESIGRRIATRFSDYINLYFSIPIDLGAMDAEYIPSDEIEREAMQMFGFSYKKERNNPPLPFDMMAQAFFAVESEDDPSFPSHMTRLAREALITGQYIDSFRYGFLLIEALYGNGKFRTRDLAKELTQNVGFAAMVERTIRAISGDPIHRKSAAKPAVLANGTTESLIAYLLDRRGFYFHGNLKRTDAWHPDKHDDAEAVAEIVVDLAGQISASFGSAMFQDDIGPRFMANAVAKGASMTVQVQFHFQDADGQRRVGSMEFAVPGTKATSKLAIKVSGHFMRWAETELSGETLLSARAVIKETGVEVFRAQFLRPAGENPLSA